MDGIERTINLLKFLTPVSRDNADVQALVGSETVEMQELWDALCTAFNDQFIRYMTDFGLERWEEIFDVLPRADDTYDDRRTRILTLIAGSRPYTLKRFQEMLDGIFGAGNVKASVDGRKYQFLIDIIGDLPNHQQDDLQNFIEEIIPKNLELLYRFLFIDKMSMLDGLHMLADSSCIEQYRWRGRYANGAYLAMAPVMADGEYIADGTLTGNGALPNREESYYFPYIADGEYIADGTLTADCAHQTGAIYADSLEPDLLNVCGMVANTDTYSVLLYADGKWMADGTILAGYNTHCQEAPIAIDAQETLNDSERMTDNQAITLGLCEQENSPLANMYYADGTWAAGPALEADGSYIADGEILANGLSALHSQYTAPVICDGTYLADGTRFPAARPLAGTAESDENKNESLSMFQRMAASDAVSAAEADDVDVDIAAHDWLDNGHQANGEYTANGAIVGAGHASGDTLTTSSTLRISDSIISTYYADGENMADGHIKGGETEGARDSMTVTVGLGRLADGSALANAGGAIYADGSYIADGAYTAMQFRLARHIADGSILADGSHIPGRGGDLCDYTYFAA